MLFRREVYEKSLYWGKGIWFFGSIAGRHLPYWEKHCHQKSIVKFHVKMVLRETINKGAIIMDFYP